MIRGRAVTVWRKAETGEDEMGEPLVDWMPERVENVLWGPSEYAARLSEDGARPAMTDDEITVHIPKTYTACLAGCRIEVEGALWDVVGDPQGYMPELTPGPWNRSATARKVEG